MRVHLKDDVGDNVKIGDKHEASNPASQSDAEPFLSTQPVIPKEAQTIEGVRTTTENAKFKSKGDSNKIRLSLEVSRDVNERIEVLADEIGGTKSEVLRRALVLMEVVVNARKNGRKVGIADHSVQLTTEFIGI